MAEVPDQGKGAAVPVVRHPRIAPTDDWEQLQLLAAFPEQRAYEGLRPVVLFGRPATERAGEIGPAERTLYRRVARFDADGLASLFPPPKVAKHRRLPEKIRRGIRDLKAEHPAFHAREIADICAVRFAHRPSPHTVKRILAEAPPAPPAYRRVGVAIHGAACDLSAYRLLLDGVPYVVVLGEPPDERLGERLRLALLTGHPAELPTTVVATLAARRAERRREGPWVEEHHRPGKRLQVEE